MTERAYKFDTLRALLMFSVIFGHFLEYIPGTKGLYVVIYSFHMPAFIFLSGFFAKFQLRRIVLTLFYPYIMFQSAAVLFLAYISNSHPVFQYTEPWWIFWYLPVIAVYHLLIPLIGVSNPPLRIGILLISLVISLIAGFSKDIGYQFSLSRIFTFLPFFIAGYYSGHDDKVRTKLLNTFQCKRSIKVLLLLMVIISVLLLFVLNISPRMLWGSMSYKKAHYNLPIKLILTAIASVWITALLVTIPNKRIPFLSSLGANTLPVYLLHGFIVFIIGNLKVFSLGLFSNLILALVLSYIILAVFGNSYIGKILSVIFTGEWIYKMLRKLRLSVRTDS